MTPIISKTAQFDPRIWEKLFDRIRSSGIVYAFSATSLIFTGDGLVAGDRPELCNGDRLLHDFFIKSHRNLVYWEKEEMGRSYQLPKALLFRRHKISYVFAMVRDFSLVKVR